MRPTPHQLVPYESRTAVGDSGVVDTGGGHESLEHSARVFLDVSTPTGTSPTLNVFVYGVINGKNYLLFQFAQVGAAASRQSARIDNVPRDVVVAWTLGGTTPNYTFEVWLVR